MHITLSPGYVYHKKMEIVSFPVSKRLEWSNNYFNNAPCCLGKDMHVDNLASTSIHHIQDFYKMVLQIINKITSKDIFILFRKTTMYV